MNRFAFSTRPVFIAVVSYILLISMWSTAYHASLSSTPAAAASSVAQAPVFVDGVRLSALASAAPNQAYSIQARSLLTAVKATFSYQSRTKVFSARRGSASFSCTIGSTRARANGKVITLQSPCTLQNGQPYVPLRAISEALRLHFTWYGASSVFAISSRTKSTAQVTRVIDGDTLEIRWSRGTERIRLIGVDTPETVHPTLGEEPYGREASNFTKQRLTGQSILVEFDIEARDRYNRLLGYVYLPNGEFFNGTLINDGYAQLMTFAPNVRWVSLFRELQTSARDNNRGLWNLQLNNDNGGTTGTKIDPATYNLNSGCSNPLIKGNINSTGERIYHVPGGSFYTRTVAEKMFCNEQEAVKDGFRKSLR